MKHKNGMLSSCISSHENKNGILCATCTAIERALPITRGKTSMTSESVSAAPQAQSPSRDELFRLLTEEIRDITEAKRLTGWTPWVILASLASGAWLLAQDLLTTHYSKRACVAVFLILTVILHLVRTVQADLDALSEDRSG